MGSLEGDRAAICRLMVGHQGGRGGFGVNVGGSGKGENPLLEDRPLVAGAGDVTRF